MPNVVNLWNNLDADVLRCGSIDSFKINIQQKVKDNQLYCVGSRKLSMIHAQLRMNCSNLNFDLYSLHVRDDSSCSCGFRKEDARHFFLLCPLYMNMRNEMVQFCYVNDLPLTVETLLKGSEFCDFNLNSQLFIIVQNFINQTGRFEL